MRRLRFWFLKRKANVNGLAGGVDADGRLPVFVTKKVDLKELDKKDVVPEKLTIGLKRFETKVVEVGEVKAFSYRAKHRPLVGGTEIAPVTRLWTGTLGVRVKRRTALVRGVWRGLTGVPDWMVEKLGELSGESYYFVTNRHVVLNEYNDLDSSVRWFRQPLNEAENVLELELVGGFQTDCALLKPLVSTDNSIVNVGVPQGVSKAVSGLRVKKHGRTTGFTEGECVRTGVSIAIDFGGNTGVRTLHGLDMFTDMSAPGDSGSVIVDDAGYVVTLLNSGSTFNTFGIPFGKVLNDLKVML